MSGAAPLGMKLLASSAVHNLSIQQPQQAMKPSTAEAGSTTSLHPLCAHIFMLGPLPTQNGGICQVWVAQDMTLF